jgi:hypothetical protein
MHIVGYDIEGRACAMSKVDVEGQESGPTTSYVYDIVGFDLRCRRSHQDIMITIAYVRPTTS